MTRKILFAAVFAYSGCSGKVSKSDLPDTYRFSIADVTQVVVVDADGKYKNTLFKDGAAIWSDEHSWTYEAHSGEKGVVFQKFRFGIPGRSSIPGWWFVVPSKTLRGFKELCFDPDLGYCFRTSQ
jgi:hypothetical protein